MQHDLRQRADLVRSKGHSSEGSRRAAWVPTVGRAQRTTGINVHARCVQPPSARCGVVRARSSSGRSSRCGRGRARRGAAAPPTASGAPAPGAAASRCPSRPTGRPGVDRHRDPLGGRRHQHRQHRVHQRLVAIVHRALPVDDAGHPRLACHTPRRCPDRARPPEGTECASRGAIVDGGRGERDPAGGIGFGELRMREARDLRGTAAGTSPSPASPRAPGRTPRSAAAARWRRTSPSPAAPPSPRPPAPDRSRSRTRPAGAGRPVATDRAGLRRRAGTARAPTSDR